MDHFSNRFSGDDDNPKSLRPRDDTCALFGLKLYLDGSLCSKLKAECGSCGCMHKLQILPNLWTSNGKRRTKNLVKTYIQDVYMYQYGFKRKSTNKVELALNSCQITLVVHVLRVQLSVCLSHLCHQIIGDFLSKMW